MKICLFRNSMIKYHLKKLNVFSKYSLMHDLFYNPTHKVTNKHYYFIEKAQVLGLNLFKKNIHLKSFIEKRFYDEFHPFSFRPCPCGRIVCHVNLDSILCGKKIPKISCLCMSSKDYFKILSCSLAHAQVHMLTRYCRWVVIGSGQ
jgi:hypothetical protein